MPIYSWKIENIYGVINSNSPEEACGDVSVRFGGADVTITELPELDEVGGFVIIAPDDY